MFNMWVDKCTMLWKNNLTPSCFQHVSPFQNIFNISQRWSKKNAVLEWGFHLLREEKLSKPTWPYVEKKKLFPSLLSHELTVSNHIFWKLSSLLLAKPRPRLWWTMLLAIIHKWKKTVVNITRSGQPTKITPREHERLI